MGFFDSIKNFKNQIDQIESSVYSGKQSLLEVYERNLKLEAEIEVRTRELDTANRQMLTLQHVWDMMNSSKPLSSVLNAIARSLQGELGYLNTCIPKRLVDDKGVYLQLVSFSGELFGSSFLKFFKCEPSDLRLEFPTVPHIVEAIEELKGKLQVSFVVDTLTYLHRGGRCGSVAMLAGGVLKLHPKIVVEDGGMIADKKYRGKMNKVILDYVKEMEEEIQSADTQYAIITHSGCEQEIIDEVYAYLDDMKHFDEIIISRAGGVISSHCGPGTLGVMFIKK